MSDFIATLEMRTSDLVLTIEDERTGTTLMRLPLPLSRTDQAVKIADHELKGLGWTLLEPWTQETPTSWVVPVVNGRPTGSSAPAVTCRCGADPVHQMGCDAE